MSKEEYRTLYLLLARLLSQERINADLVDAIYTVLRAVLDRQPVV